MQTPPLELKKLAQDRFKVYKITNRINSKVYIGKTMGALQRRFEAHLSGEGGASKLFEDVQKFGHQSFVIEQIDSASSPSELADKEELWIRKLNSVKTGYNSTYRSIGGTFSARARWDRLSAEEKAEEIRHVNKVRWSKATPEQRKKIGQAMKSGWASKSRSQTVKQNWDNLTPEQRKSKSRGIAKSWDHLTPEQRSERARWANLVAAQRRKSANAS